MSTGQYHIPFNGDGDQLDFPHYQYGEVDPNTWVGNFEFEDALTFRDWAKGRSSVTFYMVRASNGKRVTMFMKDFTDAIPHMVNGVIKGKFTFIKRGQNYGCKLA